MTIADSLAQAAARLPPDKQQEVLDFAESLAQKQTQQSPLRDIGGHWKGVNVSESDIAAMRKEAWGQYMGGGS